MRVELNQLRTEDPFRIIVDVVGDDFRTDFSLAGDDLDDARFELLALGDYVYLREASNEWIRRERPEYVPTLAL
jgi:hypothetical protein